MIQGANSDLFRNDKILEIKKNQETYEENWKFQNPCLYEKETVSSVKTIIAPSVGTTKSVAMFKRPEPPKRPRSNISIVRPRHVSLKNVTTDKKLTLVRKGPDLAAEQKHKTDHLSENKESSSKSKEREESSSKSKEREESSALDSYYNEKCHNSKLKTQNNEFVRKNNGLTTRNELEIPEYREKSGSMDGSQLRSALELLEEAESITSLNSAKINDTKFQLKMPQETAFSANLPAKANARSVDEIIASLKSTGYSASQSASDQMIKELMEKVFGHEKNSMNEAQEFPNELPVWKSAETVSVNEQDLSKILAAAETNCPTSTVSPEECSNIMSKESESLESHMDKEEARRMLSLPAQEFPTELPVQKYEETVSVNEQDSSKILTGVEETNSPPTSIVLSEARSKIMSKKSEGLESHMDKEEAQRMLSLSAQVTYSDIMYVKGTTIKINENVTALRQQQTEERCKQHTPFSLLATWTPKDKDYHFETIHHICTAFPSHVLPTELRLASRMYFTPSHKNKAYSKTYDAEVKSLCQKEAGGHENYVTFEEDSKTNRILYEGIPVSEASKDILNDSVKLLPPHRCESLAEWQKIAEYYVEGPRLELVGQKANIYPDATKIFWTPAPPKFSAPISLVQETVFPKYQGIVNYYEIHVEGSYISIQSENEDMEDEQKEEEEDRAALMRVLSRLHQSLPDVRQPSVSSEKKEICKVNKIARSESMPEICSSKATTALKLSTNFQTAMKELELLRKQITHPKTEVETEGILPAESPSKEDLAETAEELKEETHLKVATHENEQRRWPVKTSPAEEARKAGKKYVILPKTKKKKKSKKTLDAKKIEALREKINQPTRVLKRCESLPRLSINIEPRLKVQPKIFHRSLSMPDILDIKKFSEDRGGIPENTVIREWVRDIWNTWFDEVFPPSRASSSNEIEKVDLSTSQQQQPEAEEKVYVEIQLTDTFSPVLTDESEVCAENVLSEVKHLTNLIEEQPSSAAFHYCRRGALNRILGNTRMSMEDLNKAIHMEPMLLDSYWHRHLLYLLQSKDNYALDDLNFIIKHNKHHADAYRSKAEIYRRQGDITMAVISYTQAIKCNPTDESYFRRGKMYEKRNEMLLAMEDYAMVFAINPKRTDALMRHGLYHFENSNWNGAVRDFTSLIKHDHNNAVARTYRGRAYTNLMQYKEAIEDFSAAVHLDPNNWIAFHYRGCLLRKLHPVRALQDLSVSVLLNDSFENINAFLQRGTLYTELQQWSEAVCDFENVLILDRTVAVAHVNLGLVFMLKMDHYYEAVRRFTDAIKVSPTYTRAYICRAQAYHKLHNLQKALRDLTRAIHLHPDNHQLYIMRGQYLFEMKKFELASFCIHHAAEINQALKASPVQQALVHSFRQNYSKAIECLVSAISVRPSPSLLVLLGKTQMKAKKTKEALQSFEEALHLLTKDDAKPNRSEAAEIFYLIGLCYVEQVHLLKALDAFTDAVKIFPDHADAYYQRGLCKMHINQVKCIRDFNRALTCNPNHFQAYLSRAAFYGIKGLYTKAILNCNEALRIQPKSVRAYLYRGALKYYIKAYHYAIEDLTTAISLEKACTLAYYNRAVCYHQTKEFDKALKDYGIVLLLGGRKEIDLKVHINRGLLYLELNQYFSALQDFAAAVVKSPADSLICHAVGICHHRLEEFEKAVNAFSQALKLNPLCVDACVGRGNSYMEYGHECGTKQAQKDFLRALHLNPKCLKARINMGYNLQVLGQFQKAWTQFTVALDIDSKCQAAYEGRAIVNLQMSDTFAAFHDISAALKLGVSAKLLTNRGVINQFMGDLHNAMKDYQAAVVLDPSYSMAYFNAANIYFYSKQFNQARDYYTRAVSLDPRNESAVLNRAITHSLLQDSQKALEDFRQAAELTPYSSHIYFNRANLYKALKQYELAEKDYSHALALQPNDALIYKFRADVRGKLGLKEEAISDYKCAIDIQEAVKAK